MIVLSLVGFLPQNSVWQMCVWMYVDVSSIGQKKFYFFLPKTIWRFHQVVPAPLLSFDKSFLSCSSYLCSEKISSKFHSISISSWIRETAAPVTAISPTLQFIQVSHKRIQIKFRCALFHVHVWKTNHHTWHYSVNRHNALSCRII